MIGVRDITTRDLARLLYLAHWNDYLMAQEGPTHIYMNGAFTILAGVLPESLLSICQTYAHGFDGDLVYK